MIDERLNQKHTGKLCVTIHSLGGESGNQILDFRDTTIFDYIGEACGRIFANLTTQPTIETSPENWQISRFSPEDGVLVAVQISGQPLQLEGDDFERLVPLWFAL